MLSRLATPLNAWEAPLRPPAPAMDWVARRLRPHPCEGITKASCPYPFGVVPRLRPDLVEGDPRPPALS